MTKNLVLLPGLTNTSEIWDGVLEELPETIKGYAFDVPAQPTLEEIVEELLLDLPEEFYLCGFSFGGYVALEILNKVPERVLGLIMMGSVVRGDSESQKAARIKTIERIENGDYIKMIDENTRWLFHRESIENNELIDLHKKISKEYQEARYVAHLQAAMSRQDYTDLVKESSIEKLFIAGESDQIMPAKVLKKQSDAIQDSTLTLITNTGHMMPLEQPLSVANAMAAWINAEE